MEIYHKYTRYITCPYCGYEDKDSWEACPGKEDLGIIECGRCEEEFYASRIVTVEYSTYKIER